MGSRRRCGCTWPSHNVRVTEIVAGRVETALYRDALPTEAHTAMYAVQSAAQPSDVAAMMMAVLNLPAAANVARYDILLGPSKTVLTCPLRYDGYGFFGVERDDDADGFL